MSRSMRMKIAAISCPRLLYFRQSKVHLGDDEERGCYGPEAHVQQSTDRVTEMQRRLVDSSGQQSGRKSDREQIDHEDGDWALPSVVYRKTSRDACEEEDRAIVKGDDELLHDKT